MSPSAKAAWKNGALVLAGAGVVAMAWVSLAQILRVDAFAKFQHTGTPVGAELGVSIDDFEFKAYEAGRLAALAEVDHVQVRRDRSMLEMQGVRNGRFIPAEGDPFSFDMKTATYHYFQNRMDAKDGAHVFNDEMDLRSQSFIYDGESKTLLVHGKVQGRLFDGEAVADDVSVDTATRDVLAYNVRWIGEAQDPAQEGQRKKWDISGATVQSKDGGKTTVYTKGRATDGEIIVVADTVEYTKETDVLVAKGNVKYWGADANLACDEATVFRKERRSVLTGTVRMMLKSQDDEKVVESDIPVVERVSPASLKTNPQGATQEQVDVLRATDNIRKFPVKVVADRIEYWYKKGERRAVITGSPFARQDLAEGWRLAWSVTAFYDGEKETLTMRSTEGGQDVKFVLSIGDTFDAGELTVSTKEGDDSFSGVNIKASMFLDEDEVPARTGGGTTGGGTGGRR